LTRREVAAAQEAWSAEATLSAPLGADRAASTADSEEVAAAAALGEHETCILPFI
jgi:hypothetical protein